MRVSILASLVAIFLGCSGIESGVKNYFDKKNTNQNSDDSVENYESNDGEHGDTINSQEPIEPDSENLEKSNEHAGSNKINQESNESYESEDNTDNSQMESNNIDTSKNDESTQEENEMAEAPFQISKMAIVGDSIAVGALRDISSGGSIEPSHPLIDNIFIYDTLSDILQSVDSHYKSSTDFHAFYTPNDPDCKSHACRLSLSGEDVENHAISGSTVKDMIPQKEEITESVSYLVMSVGGNDFCSQDYSLDNFASDFELMLEQVSSIYGGRMLIVPPPNIPNLFKELTSSTQAFILQSIFGPQTYTCGQIRDGGIFNASFCDRMVNLSPAEELNISQEYLEMIQRITDLVNNSQYENFDIVSDIANLQITRDEVAADCFHPSTSGHEKIADETWKVAEKLLGIK